MSATTAGHRRIASPLTYRLRRYSTELLCAVIGFIILVWSVLPIYNMVMISLDSHDDIFSGQIWPEHPSLESFKVVVTQDFWYLARFWHQFGNSFFVGLMTMFLTLVIGSLASFTVGRMRLRQGWMLSNAALMTYVIPASFLAIPLYRVMQIYGLTNSLWAVILSIVTFSTPYAIFIFSQYGKSIPMELDEFGTYRRGQPAADLSSDLSAVDGAGIGRCRHLCAAAGMERVPVQLLDAVHTRKHDRCRCAGAVPQQR